MNNVCDCPYCFLKLPVSEDLVLCDHHFLVSLTRLLWVLLAALIYEMGDVCSRAIARRSLNQRHKTLVKY